MLLNDLDTKKPNFNWKIESEKQKLENIKHKKKLPNLVEENGLVYRRFPFQDELYKFYGFTRV